MLSSKNSSDTNRYLFSTKEFDPRSGLYYFGARYYDPEVGRWLTPDPMGFVDGMNLYAYVNNNPINLIDPHGYLGERITDWWDSNSDSFFDNLEISSHALITNPLADGTLLPIDQGAGLVGLGIAKTGRVGRVFWSGGEKAINAATNFAKQNWSTTLEMTKSGKRLQSAAKATRRGWIYASKRFAQGAEGVVHVFRKAVVDSQSVWKLYEEPILRNNPKVKEIIEHIIK